MTIEWDGITKSEVIRNDEIIMRHQIADAARDYNWNKTLEILNERLDLINVTRPDGQALYTPLHQAAHGNAPVEVVQQMVAMGAWRTLKNAHGERAVDIARRKKHQHLLQLLEPVYKTHVSQEALQKIQQHFHKIILEQAGNLVKKSQLRLPELVPLLEIDKPKMWFPVPGMYGGFSYWLEGEGEDTKLIAESWCRVVEGSGKRHVITIHGTELVDKGFV